VKPIPEEIVEKTWREVAQFTPAQIKKEISRLAREQGDLLVFVLESTVDMSRASHELAVYLFFTVFRMFQKVHGKGITPISSGQVVACYEANENLMERLEGAHEKFLDRIAGIQIAEQPHVMKYVVEALVEAEEEDEDLEELTEEDKGLLFLVLKTVVELLSKVTEKEGSPH
jgi:hypothetical protein